MPRNMRHEPEVMDFEGDASTVVTMPVAQSRPVPAEAPSSQEVSVRDAGPAPRVVLDEATKVEIERLFGLEAMADPAKATAIANSIKQFRHHTGRILHSVVALGRSLLELRVAVGGESMSRAVRESHLIFRGWSRGNLVKMMAVAEFVDRLGCDLDALPQGWTTVYELSTIPEAQMDRVRNGNLLAPTVTRNQVKAFKLRLARGEGADPVSPASPEDALRAKLVKLKASLASLEERRKELQKAVRETEAALAA